MRAWISPLRLNRIACVVAIATIIAGLPKACRAGDAYYLIMFASQTIPNQAKYSHSFATFVRETWPGDEPGPGDSVLESHTISWLPANGIVRPNALFPECGRNFGLRESIMLAQQNGERVSLWGPYRIEPELYYRALQRIEELESGSVRYKANDSGRLSDHVSNCIHGVAVIARGTRLRVASPGWGEVASYAILHRLAPWVIDRRSTQDWVTVALGLDAYPIIYRDWRPPMSGAFVGPVYRLFGGEEELEATYGPPPCRNKHHRVIK
jgi:hypothetical protein